MKRIVIYLDGTWTKLSDRRGSRTSSISPGCKTDGPRGQGMGASYSQ